MAGDHDWNASLCSCFDDWGSCCYGCWCLPCLFGSNSEKVNDSNCVGMCCLYTILTQCYLCWIPHYYERQALRQKYNLRENPSCGDCLTTCCCGPCAICQEAREIKSRDNAVVYTSGIQTYVNQQPSAPRGVYPDVYRV